MAQTKSIQIKGLAKRKGKNVQQAPITKKGLMGLLAIFLVVAVALTIDPIAEAAGKVVKVSSGTIRKHATRVLGLAGGVFFLVMSASMVGVPIIAGALALTGILLIGWQVFLYYRENAGTDVGGGDLGNRNNM